MSGINTVSGLKNVSIDYRPQVGPDAANATGATWIRRKSATTA